MLSKKEDFYGETYPLPVLVETPTGISNVFANAQLPNQLINAGSGTAGNLGPQHRGPGKLTLIDLEARQGDKGQASLLAA